MKNITIADCLELKEKFDRYCETAEQHEFPFLLMVNVKMDNTIKKLQKDGEIKNQKEIRSMFRVVLKIIGEDFSEYLESEAE